MIYLIPYYFSNGETKLELIETWNLSLIKGFLIPVAGLTSLIFYTFRSYRLIRHIEGQYNIQIIKGSHWLGKIFKAFAFFVGISLLQFVMIFTGLSAKTSDVIIALGLSIFIYFIGYLGLRMSKLLNGIKVDTSKYKSTTLTRKFAKEMFNKLTQHITTKKVYTDNNLKLPDLAEQMSLTPHQLSQIINEQTGQNFSEFINSYRINEALNLIHDFDRMNQLAYEVGFNNRTTFNKIFKKTTGKTPTEYKRESRAR
jgi:AraC-like DNA-binding protein